MKNWDISIGWQKVLAVLFVLNSHLVAANRFEIFTGIIFEKRQCCRPLTLRIP